jgi:transposase-like protein
MPEQLFKVIIPVKLFCPYCGARHVDESRNSEKWDRRAHTTHRCQSCGKDWDVYVSGAADEVAVVDESTKLVARQDVKPGLPR